MTNILPTTEAPGMDGLTTSDRCDRCGARAFVVTGHGTSVLMWCIHHFTPVEHLLAAQVLHDERPAKEHA